MQEINREEKEISRDKRDGREKSVFNDPLHTPDLPVSQSNLDSVRMAGRIGKNIPDGAEGFAARALVLLEHDGYF